MWIFWNILAVATACPEQDVSIEALTRTLQATDDAIESLDVQALDRASSQLEHTVSCLSQPLDLAHAASIHRVLGIHAFVSGDEARADLYFAASRALDPTGSLGHPIGGPLEAAWRRASSPSAPVRVELPAPREGFFLIDGQPLQSAPALLPYVFQHSAAEFHTSLQEAGTLPAYAHTSPPAPPSPSGRRGRPFTFTALGVGVGAVAALTGAAITRARYKSPDQSDEAAASLIPLNQALGVTGYTLAGIAAGLGVVAVAVEW